MRAGSCCRRLSGGKRPHGLTRCGLTARPCYTMGCGGEEGGRGIAGTGAPPSAHSPPRGSRRGPRCMLVAWRGDDGHGRASSTRVANRRASSWPAASLSAPLGGVFREDAVTVTEDALPVTGLMGWEQPSRG